jgi:ABC-2 type transport system permease protein
MNLIRSWRALLLREFLEHRVAFQWVPLGILVLLAASGISAMGLHRVDVLHDMPMFGATKLFELGYLLLLCLWLAYLAVTLFFYFGDAFSADRRNNAMLFWKSMPVSDLRILVSKTLAGLLLFPAVILVVGFVSGLVLYLLVNIGAYLVPGLGFLGPLDAAAGYLQVSLYGVAFYFLMLLWYAPFFAWVGALSTVVGRWSLPLAFVIPGMIAIIENIVFFGQGPRGGVVWAYLSARWNFPMNDADFTTIVFDPRTFNAGFHIARLVHNIDWVQVGTGLAFAAAMIWLASEYRRRRIN